MRPFDAFTRLCYEVIDLEALVNAASAAIDVCTPPAESTVSFDRAQSLIGNAAERAEASLALIKELKAALRTHDSELG